MSYYDLTKVDAVKKSFDKLAINLSKENKKKALETLRGSKSEVSLIHYFDEIKQDEWIEYPYFDIYDLCEQISLSKNF